MSKTNIPKKPRNKFGVVKNADVKNYITTQQMMMTSSNGGGSGGGTIINNQVAVAIGNQIAEKTNSAKEESYTYVSYTLGNLSYVTLPELQAMSYITQSDLSANTYATQAYVTNECSYIKTECYTYIENVGTIVKNDCYTYTESVGTAVKNDCYNYADSKTTYSDVEAIVRGIISDMKASYDLVGASYVTSYVDSKMPS